MIVQLKKCPHSPPLHLSYCTNIHPAESWPETFKAISSHTLAVRQKLRKQLSSADPSPFAIGLRLSALAAEQLLEGCELDTFQDWLKQNGTYVYTINGFPYGAFHDTRVKEKVYQPDWSTRERLLYTCQLFNIIAEICPREAGGSVSTLPGSFKEFNADESLIFQHLYACAEHIELLSEEYQKDLHLGLEPEPLGHFENTEETIAFFARFHQWASDHDLPKDILQRRVGLNYDTCHFALEYENFEDSITRFTSAGIRISKIHLSNALTIDPTDSNAVNALKDFDEPTYLHQVLTLNAKGEIRRYKDLPIFFDNTNERSRSELKEARIHFHIPLYDDPVLPLGSTRSHAEDALSYLRLHPETCPHIEMETYTWGVLPSSLQRDIDDQLTQEYLWTLEQLDQQ